jgi:hypothetical protein
MTQIPVSSVNLLTPSDYSKVRMELFEKTLSDEYKVRYADALTFLKIAVDEVVGSADQYHNTLGKIQAILALLDGSVSARLKLDQSTKQTVSASPIFSNLTGAETSARIVAVHSDGSLRDLSNVFYDLLLSAFRANKLVADNGSASAPSVTFLDNVTMGLYRAGSNLLGVAVAGSNVLTFSSNQIRAGNSGTAATPIWTWGVDLDTGVFRPASDNIAVTTGGVERNRVNASGKHGFGTQSPTKVVHVAGEAGYLNTSDEGTGDTDFASHKWVNDKKLVTNITSNATLAPTGSAPENELYVTALAEDAEFSAPSGTLVNGNTLLN